MDASAGRDKNCLFAPPSCLVLFLDLFSKSTEEIPSDDLGSTMRIELPLLIFLWHHTRAAINDEDSFITAMRNFIFGSENAQNSVSSFFDVTVTVADSERQVGHSGNGRGSDAVRTFAAAAAAHLPSTALVHQLPPVFVRYT